MRHKKIFSIIFSFLFFPFETISAHCPLCTAGAGAAVSGAVLLGMNKIIIALFLGAFSMSMGMWFARILSRKKIIAFQNHLLILIIFLLTLLPLMPFVEASGQASFFGRSYFLNYSLISALFGGFVVFVTHKINKKIKKRIKGIPYQGILITFSALLVSAFMINYFLR